MQTDMILSLIGFLPSGFIRDWSDKASSFFVLTTRNPSNNAGSKVPSIFDFVASPCRMRWSRSLEYFKFVKSHFHMPHFGV